MRAVPARNPHHAPLCRSAGSFEPATAYTTHCIARAAQDIKIHYGPTFDRPTCHLRGRYRHTPSSKRRREMAAWVSSIHGLNQKITPSTSGGHAQSQVQSSPAFSPSPEGRLTRTEALVSFRVLNRIKPQNPVHVWNSANFFKFHSCGHTLQETRRLCFRLGRAHAYSRSHGAHTASQQSLWLGLLRSLIVIDTPTLVLGRRASPRWALSPPVVLAGSANSTSRQPVLPPSNFSLLYRGLRARPLSEESTLGAQIKARPPPARPRFKKRDTPTAG